MAEMELDGCALTQWDTGRRVLLRGDPDRVHFAHDKRGRAYVVVPYEEGGETYAAIPDVLLQEGREVLAWEFEDGRTTGFAAFRVRPRARPDTYACDPDVVETVESLRAWVEEKVSEAEGCECAPCSDEDIDGLFAAQRGGADAS